MDGIIKCVLSTYKQVSETVNHRRQREALIILSTAAYHQTARTHLLTQIPFTLSKYVNNNYFFQNIFLFVLCLIRM